MAFLFIEILWQSFDSFETLCTNLWCIYTKRKIKPRNENVRCLGNYTQHSHINSDGFIYTNIKCQANDIIFHINNRLYKKICSMDFESEPYLSQNTTRSLLNIVANNATSVESKPTLNSMIFSMRLV